MTVQISPIGSRPRFFQRRTHEASTFPLSPQKGWLNSTSQFCLFGAPKLISTGFASWQHYCMALQQWASAWVTRVLVFSGLLTIYVVLANSCGSFLCCVPYWFCRICWTYWNMIQLHYSTTFVHIMQADGRFWTLTTYLVCGVLQGSVLGPILFVLYTVDLLMVIESYGLSPHMYADDTQVYGSCRPSAVTTFTTKVSECVEATTSWMRSKRLQPNPEKTEVLWCSTARRQHHWPTSPLLIDGCSVSPVKSVRDLGIYIDSDLTMQMCRDVSPRCVSCVKSVTWCRQPHSRCWWLLWSTPDWTTEIACWSACRLTSKSQVKSSKVKQK